MCSNGNGGRQGRHKRKAIKLVKLREAWPKKAAAAVGKSIATLELSVHLGMLALRKALGTTD